MPVRAVPRVLLLLRLGDLLRAGGGDEASDEAGGEEHHGSMEHDGEEHAAVIEMLVLRVERARLLSLTGRC